MWPSILIRRALSVALILVGWPPASIRVDHFVYRDRANAKVEIDARLVATGQGVLVLEPADGQFRLVPEGMVEKRQPADGPAPASADEVAAGLRDRFGADLFRSVKQDPFVLGVVLMAPLPKAGESRATNFLRSAGKFLKNVEGAFVGFVKEARLPANPPTHPLDTLKTSPLSMHYANKVMKNVATPGNAQRYQVRVRAVPTDSDDANRWKKGDLPVPAFSRNRSGG